MYNTPLLLAAATLPSMVIAYWIYRQDYHESEPSGLLLWAFVCGCLSTIPAVIMQSFFKHLENPNSLYDTAIFAFGIVAVSEELSKYFLLRRFIYPKKDFNEPFDGIIYGVMVGLGFATLENVLYVLKAGPNGFSTALARAFTAVPAHAAFGVLMGSYVGLAKYIPQKAIIYTVIGVGLAVFFHGAYDFFLMQQVYEGMAGLAIFTLIWGIIMSRQLIRAGQEISPFKNGQRLEPIADISEVTPVEIEGEVDEKVENKTEDKTGEVEIENKDFI
jgi:protease PrsW